MLISATRIILLTVVHLQELYLKKMLPVIQTSVCLIYAVPQGGFYLVLK
jgi:hypothetical protein